MTRAYLTRYALVVCILWNRSKSHDLMVPEGRVQ